MGANKNSPIVKTKAEIIDLGFLHSITNLPQQLSMAVSLALT